MQNYFFQSIYNVCAEFEGNVSMLSSCFSRTKVHLGSGKAHVNGLFGENNLILYCYFSLCYKILGIIDSVKVLRIDIY